MVTAIIDDLSNARETAEAYNEYVTIFQGYRGEPASVLEYTTHPLWIGVKGLVANLYANRKTFIYKSFSRYLSCDCNWIYTRKDNEVTAYTSAK
jgi:hypothetical protein